MVSPLNVPVPALSVYSVFKHIVFQTIDGIPLQWEKVRLQTTKKWFISPMALCYFRDGLYQFNQRMMKDRTFMI